MKKKGRIGIVILLLISLFTFKEADAIVRVLSWQPPTLNQDGTVCLDLGGYVIRYGESSRTYDWQINVGNVTEYQIELYDDVNYYIATTAYDTAGNESEYSNEVVAQAVVEFSFYCDSDNDGYLSDTPSGYCNGVGCEPIECELNPGNDCDDGYATVNVAASDNNCDGVDDNCDGMADNYYQSSAISCGGNCGLTGEIICSNGALVDTCLFQQDNCVLAYYCDADADGYASEIPDGYCNGDGCVPDGCGLIIGSDCDDEDYYINVGAIDNNCDGIDDNCDGVPDEGADCSMIYLRHLFVSDINLNGAAEAVALKADNAGPKVVVVDSGTGAIIGQIFYFNANAIAMEFTAYPDMNGNGIPEVGVLAYDFNTESTVYEIRDLATGSLFQDPQSITLDAPSGLTVSFADEQIILDWQSVANALSYDIYRDGQYVGSSVSNMFTDINVTKGAVYNYKAVAVNGSSSSLFSEELSAEACYLPARVGGQYYSTLQEAYNAVPNGYTVQFRSQTPNQGLIANINKAIVLDGGYDCDYTSSTCNAMFSANVSVLNGQISIGDCQASSLDYQDHLYYSDGGNLKLAAIGHVASNTYVYIIDVNTGVLEKQIPYFTNNHTPLGATKYIIGNSTLIGVLARDEASGNTKIEIRHVSGDLY